MGKKVILINPGHGGLVEGIYQTAPKKMFDHKEGGIAYEGVINRNVANYILSGLKLEEIRCINLCPTELDLPLSIRVEIANRYCDYYGKENVLGIDLHSNAGGGIGFEGWTAPGYTKSDDYMTLFIQVFAEHFPNWKIRTDKSDNDPDKESPFYMLVNTNCSWILPEWGFFDNLHDWEIISNPRNQLLYANMIVDFCTRIISNNY